MNCAVIRDVLSTFLVAEFRPICLNDQPTLASGQVSRKVKLIKMLLTITKFEKWCEISLVGKDTLIDVARESGVSPAISH